MYNPQNPANPIVTNVNVTTIPASFLLSYSTTDTTDTTDITGTNFGQGVIL